MGRRRLRRRPAGLAAQTLHLAIPIVKRTEAHRFVVLPRRWVVERTLAWITRHRRCARDYEGLPAHHEPSSAGP